MKFLNVLLVLFLAGSISAVFGQNASTPAAPQRPMSGPPGMGDFFPPRMQSFPLYGDGAVPNSKPGPDEESTGPFIRRVSRPQIQVYLPAKSKANGASVLVFPGGGYSGLTFDNEGTAQAQFFVDHGIAAFVVKYRIPSDQIMEDKSIGPLQDAQQAMRYASARRGVESGPGTYRRNRILRRWAPGLDPGDALQQSLH